MHTHTQVRRDARRVPRLCGRRQHPRPRSQRSAPGVPRRRRTRRGRITEGSCGEGCCGGGRAEDERHDACRATATCAAAADALLDAPRAQDVVLQTSLPGGGAAGAELRGGEEIAQHELGELTIQADQEVMRVNARRSGQQARLAARRPPSSEFATGAVAAVVQDAGGSGAGKPGAGGGGGGGGGGERQVRAATAQWHRAHPHADAAYGRKSRLNLPRPHSCAPQISHAAWAADDTAWEDHEVDAGDAGEAGGGGARSARVSALSVRVSALPGHAVPGLNSSIKGRGEALQAAPSTQPPAPSAPPATSGPLPPPAACAG